MAAQGGTAQKHLALVFDKISSNITLFYVKDPHFCGVLLDEESIQAAVVKVFSV